MKNAPRPPRKRPPPPAAGAGSTRTQIYVPKREPPTRHPRRVGAGGLHVGERLAVRFSGVDADGAAVARLGVVRLAVPFGVPGEEALIEVTKGGRHARGKLVALIRKLPEVEKARCRHFGRCGGCQWQHLLPELQRRLKTRMVKDYLKEHAGIRRDMVAETTGDGPWRYRSIMRVVFGVRDGTTIVGYHASGEPRVLDIGECPIQHPANEAMIAAARHAARALGLPVYNRETGRGLLRGVVGTVSFATGEALMTLSLTAPLPDTAPLVYALIDRVPGMVGILLTAQPRPTLELLGDRVRLLWGKDHVTDQIAGFRVRVRPDSDLPPNPAATAVLVEVVHRLAAPRPGETVFDLTAGHPLYVMALAESAEVAIGLAPSHQALMDARDAASANGVPNAVFYGRNPLRVFERIVARGRRPAVVVARAQGRGLPSEFIRTVAAAGTARVVYVARSLAVCAHDLRQWEMAGYEPCVVQPVDLLPQTSNVHCVVALDRAGFSR